MKKLHLILLSLVAAVPGGYLCYLLGTALALPRSDLWKKPLLGGAVVGTGLLVLLAAVVWPLLYAIAFYDDPNKSRKAADGEAGAEDAAVDELEEDKPKTPRAETFEEEDVDVFEREGVTADAEEASDDDDFESLDSEDAEFDVEEESLDQAETADFDLGDDEFADLEMDEELEEEEEEAPKKKAKKKKK